MRGVVPTPESVINNDASRSDQECLYVVSFIDNIRVRNVFNNNDRGEMESGVKET
jgi:hypothetical protein